MTSVYNEGKQIIFQLHKFWGSIDPNVKTKFENINNKTGRYYVPEPLFTGRTSRKNRVLIPWSHVKKNNLSFENLENFEGGVYVEFNNNDILDFENELNSEFGYLFKKLFDVIGNSDNLVSSFVSFRNTDGSSGSQNSMKCYNKFIEFGEQKHVKFKSFTCINRKNNTNYSNFKNNNMITGELFYELKGGNNKSIESHPYDDTKERKGKPMLFNPAIEYANERTMVDIELVLSYFALHIENLEKQFDEKKINDLKNKVKDFLKKRNYDDRNLLDYCDNHYSLTDHPIISKNNKKILIDPISMTPIKIEYFKFKSSEKNDCSIELSHNEAAAKNKIYFDKTQNCILSAARPTNLFWSTKFSNTQQRDYTLKDYLELEKKRVSIREQIKND